MVIESSSNSQSVPGGNQRRRTVTKMLQNVLEKEISRKDIEEIEVSDTVDIITVYVPDSKRTLVIAQVLNQIDKKDSRSKLILWSVRCFPEYYCFIRRHKDALKAIHELINQ